MARHLRPRLGCQLSSPPSEKYSSSEPNRTQRQAGPWTLLLLAALLSDVPSTHAKTWRVWKDGSGDFTAIQPAVDAAAEGDTVLIGPGRYTESFDFDFDGPLDHGETFIGVRTNGLTLMGVHRDSVVIGPYEQSFEGFLPKGIAMQYPATTGLRVENLTVKNVREGLRLVQDASVYNCRADSCGIGIIALPESLAVRGTEVAHCSVTGVTIVGPGTATIQTSSIGSNVGGVSLLQGANGVLEDCEVSGNAGGLNVQGASSVVVRGGSLVDNQFESVTLTDASVASLFGLTIRGGRTGIVAGLDSQVVGSRNILGPFDQASVSLLGGSRVALTYNDFRLSSPTAIRVTGYLLSEPTVIQDLRHNFWGITDSTAIAGYIQDGHDDPNVNSFVEFSPFASESTPTERQSVGTFKARFRDGQ